MSQDNQITLRGFLTAEPRYHQTRTTGTPVTELRVGSTPRRLDRETGEWVDLPTSYFQVRCWRRLAINAVGSLHKGDNVVIRGRFYMRSWTDNQQHQRSVLEIEADSLGHDLNHGWSHFMRGSKERYTNAPADAGEAARQDQQPSATADGEAPAGPGLAGPNLAGTELPGLDQVTAEWDEEAVTTPGEPTSLATGGTGHDGGTGEQHGEADDGEGHADGNGEFNFAGLAGEAGDPAAEPGALALTGSR
jgi:single-strand DNA-binding protein